MSGPTAMLIAGNMCDQRLWGARDGPLRAALARDRTMRVVDAETRLDRTIEAMARRALAASDERLLPIGFSMGAIVALEMARQAPERIVGLALFGLNAGPDLPERAAHRPVQQAEVRRGGLERILVEELKPNYLARRNQSDAELLDLARDMGMALGPDVFIAQSEALRTRADLRPTLHAFAGPILLACGAEDLLCPPAWHEAWAALAKDATLHCVADAGHMLPLEDPRALADILSHWILQKVFA